MLLLFVNANDKLIPPRPLSKPSRVFCFVLVLFSSIPNLLTYLTCAFIVSGVLVLFLHIFCLFVCLFVSFKLLTFSFVTFTYRGLALMITFEFSFLFACMFG